jgi:hypothetical protein
MANREWMIAPFTVVAACVLAAGAAVAADEGPAPNTLTDAERAGGFQLVWDGHTTRGFRGVKTAAIPKGRWSTEGGVLTAVAPPPGTPEENADIVTERSYSSFELDAEFRLAPKANSGIKYFVRTDLMADQGQSTVGLEYQIIDDAGNPDATQGRGGARSLGALYDVYGPAPDKPVKRMGEWNAARIVVRGTHVEHWLNGVKVLQFERGSEDFKAHVAEGKHRIWPGYGEWKEGVLLLQHHGGGVSFRNVKVRELSPQ